MARSDELAWTCILTCAVVCCAAIIATYVDVGLRKQPLYCDGELCNIFAMFAISSYVNMIVLGLGLMYYVPNHKKQD
jgi:hypothetical protein